jgi:ubiquinone/menaquinone biosynthesis C-methylase UbiE
MGSRETDLERALVRFEGSEFGLWSRDAVSDGLSAEERFLVERFFPEKGARTLDMGCGGGRISLALGRLGYQRVVGIDFSAKMIESARENGQRLGVEGLEFRIGQATEIPEPDASFDQALYFCQVLSCLARRSDRTKALNELYRVLRPGGRAGISVLSYWGRSYTPPLSWMLRIARALYNPNGYTGQMLPWLRKGSRPNWGFWRPGEAQVYWWYPEEFFVEVCETGFSVEYCGTTASLRAAVTHVRGGRSGFPRSGALYVVVRRD